MKKTNNSKRWERNFRFNCNTRISASRRITKWYSGFWSAYRRDGFNPNFKNTNWNLSIKKRDGCKDG